MSAAPDLVYIRNNTKNPKVLPLALGRPEGKSSRVIKINPGLNSMQPEVLRMITGGLRQDGSAKGGSAGKYFNNRELQIAHAPLEGDECHQVTSVTGIKRSRRSMNRAAEVERQSKLEGILYALLGHKVGDMSVTEVEEAAHERLGGADVAKARAEAEMAEAEARTLAAKAEAAEAQARLNALEAQPPGEPGLDPSKHTVDELRELAPMASLAELVQALQIEKAREGGGRKGALDAITDAMKA